MCDAFSPLPAFSQRKGCVVVPYIMGVYIYIDFQLKNIYRTKRGKLHTYIYIHTYICKYTHIFIYYLIDLEITKDLYMCHYMNVYVHRGSVHVYVYIYVCVQGYICTNMYACIIYMHIYVIYAYMCLCIYDYIWI